MENSPPESGQENKKLDSLWMNFTIGPRENCVVLDEEDIETICTFVDLDRASIHKFLGVVRFIASVSSTEGEY